MSLQPSWEELKSRQYCKTTQYSASGVTPGPPWWCSKENDFHSLRVSIDYVSALKSRPGPKKRRSSRIVGATPDHSYVQPGRRPSGLPWQLRVEMNRLFSCEAIFLQRMLQDSMEYKAPKKHRVNLHMPDLSVAVDDLYRAMLRRDPQLRHHPAFKGGWRPAICRLIEIKWLRGLKAKEEKSE